MGSYKWLTPNLKQAWIVFPIVLNKISLGMTMGFTTVFLSAIAKPDSDVKMDLHSSSWFVSILGIAFLFSYFEAPFLMFKYGRKKSWLINCLPSILALMAVIISKKVISLIISRLLMGITLGSAGIMAGPLIVEYTSPQNRGMLLNICNTSYSFGILLVHFLGSCVNWKILNILSILPASITIFFIFTWPESPSWLAERKQHDKSREAFFWLRGRSVETNKEIEDIIRSQHEKQTHKKVKTNVIDIFRKFKKTNFWKPTIIAIFSVMLMETSGRHVIPSYAVQLTRETMPDNGITLYYNTAVDVLVVISGIVASVLIRILKVRTLLFTTGFATVVLLCLISSSYYLIQIKVISSDYAWLPLLLFSMYCVFTNLGCTCIPLNLFGELYPIEHRAVGCVMTGIFAAVLATLALKLTPYVLVSCNAYGSFGILAICLAVNLGFLYFVMPETKNRTLIEIENYYIYGDYKGCKKLTNVVERNDCETKSLKSSVC